MAELLCMIYAFAGFVIVALGVQGLINYFNIPIKRERWDSLFLVTSYFLANVLIIGSMIELFPTFLGKLALVTIVVGLVSIVYFTYWFVRRR